MLSIRNCNRRFSSAIHIISFAPSRPINVIARLVYDFGRKMTIHSISIEPCSLSISRRHINWPLFFLVISFRWSFPIFIYIYQRTTVYVRIARVLYQPMCDTHHLKFFQKPPPCHCFRWLCVCVCAYVCGFACNLCRC